MRNFTVLHLLLFLLLMLIYQCSKAQDMLVTNKGDTLIGKVKPLTYGPDKKVQVTDDTKKKQAFSLYQIKYYVLAGEKYIPVRAPEGYFFMKSIKEGYLSLLAYQPDEKLAFDSYYLMKRDGTGITVPNLGFKKQLTRFLEDSPDLVAKIESGELGKNDLEKIVDEYNSVIDKKTLVAQQVQTEKKEVAKKVSPWETLETKVRAKEFEGKSDALDMITDIKGKISRGEKVPKFLIDGLKGALEPAELSTELDEAVKSINP